MQSGASFGEAACTIVPDIRSRERERALGGAEEVLQVFGHGEEVARGSGAADYCSSFRPPASDFRRTVFWIDRNSVQRQEVAGPVSLRSRFEVTSTKTPEVAERLALTGKEFLLPIRTSFPLLKITQLNLTAKDLYRIDSLFFSIPAENTGAPHFFSPFLQNVRFAK